MGGPSAVGTVLCIAVALAATAGIVDADQVVRGRLKHLLLGQGGQLQSGFAHRLQHPAQGPFFDGASAIPSRPALRPSNHAKLGLQHRLRGGNDGELQATTGAKEQGGAGGFEPVFAEAEKLRENAYTSMTTGQYQTALPAFWHAIEKAEEAAGQGSAEEEARATDFIGRCQLDRARIFYQLGHATEAYATVQEVLEASPGDMEATLLAAYIAFQKAELPEYLREDLQALERAVAAHPDHNEAAKLLAAMREKMAELVSRPAPTISMRPGDAEAGEEAGARGVGTPELDSESSGGEGGEGAGRRRIVGLRNEGATCYLNAVLQLLFHIPGLRRAIFGIPTVEVKEAAPPSVVLAVQRLFWHLQCGQEPQSTAELQASFGWDTVDALQQQDISDFCHLFLDLIEVGMKNTTRDGDLERLCGVKVLYTDAAEAVGWKKEREDTSMVTLIHGIREAKDVVEALELQGRPETIEDYDTEVHGKQTVQRSQRFRSLPPVLLLNINRMDFCPERMEAVKLNDRFEFPERLDLARFTAPDADGRAPPAEYALQSVIVHAGTANMGHYVAYCRPGAAAGAGDEWFLLDDDHVGRVPAREAVEGNFGSDDAPGASGARELPMSRSALAKMKSAYMLCYVRADCEAAVMNVTDIDADVPAHVREASAPNAFSPPVTLGVRLPETLAPVDEAGAVPAPDEAAVERVQLRGTRVEVSLPGDASVDDLTASVLDEAARRGMHLRPRPGFEAFGGAPEFAAEEGTGGEGGGSGAGASAGAVDVGLCLTAAFNHRIFQTYSPRAAVGEVEQMFLLRAEWVDRQPGAHPVGLMRIARVPAAPAEAPPGGAGGGAAGDGKGGGHEAGEEAGEEVLWQPHGDPMLITIYERETVASAKRRVSALTGVPVGEMELAWVHSHREPFVMSDAAAPMLPDPRLLQMGHQVAMVCADKGDGPDKDDFMVGSNPLLDMARGFGSATGGVKLRA